MIADYDAAIATILRHAAYVKDCYGYASRHAAFRRYYDTLFRDATPFACLPPLSLRCCREYDVSLAATAPCQRTRRFFFVTSR